MKAQSFRIPLLIAAFSIAAPISLHAAPSLPITEPPVTSSAMDGPPVDPWSINGQWFLDVDGTEEYRPYEFHDNIIDHGGGIAQHLAIEGVVVNVQYDAVGGTSIIKFTVDATIFNDTSTAEGQESDASNSHSESRLTGAQRYIGTLVDTKLTAEFAIGDISLLPSQFTGPYREVHPFIIADNEDQHAWYCWNDQETQAVGGPGNYYVPTWDFGDIPTGQASTRTLVFSVDPPMDPSLSDPRYNVITNSMEFGEDIFANRTTSLKISTWIDDVAVDPGTDYPDEVLRSSDVSVFHYIEEEPEYPHKMHWPQLPDPNGWDVRACATPPTDLEPEGIQKVLADDFQCTSNGFINHITFWGSWASNLFDEAHSYQGITNIHLSIHADIPAGELAQWSMPQVPALMEWNIDPANLPPGWVLSDPFEEEPSDQGWYDPNIPFWELNNHNRYFRYEIFIPNSDAFEQVEGTYYWLDISVETEYGLWGWKTSRSEHFLDDAVWADLPVLDPDQWRELRDPITEESLDLAFIINETTLEEEFDFGDAPDWTMGTGPGDYETILADSGAHHNIVAGAPYFDDGTQTDQPDGEPDGQPDPNALGDDTNGTSPDDEDGIVFPVPLVAGQASSVDITVDTGGGGIGQAWVDGWIDFNANGDWTDVGEQIQSGWLPHGLTTVGFTVPAGTSTGQTFARFRINSSGALLPTGGPAIDGEVEDHEVFIEEPPRDMDYGDAPDAFYQTLLASDGARHLPSLPSSPFLGALIDIEPDGQPTLAADGDDINNLNDEDGIVFTTALISGTPATVQVVVTGSGGILQGWIDWNADGDWGDASEQIITDVSVAAGINTVNFSVPTWATNIPTYARFRISTTPGLPSSGLAQDGEVEDYVVDLEDLKWLQIPEQGQEGVDVNNTHFMLADDFECTASGPITDIHIWGSFLNDILPPEGPGGLIFKLSIWSDVPAGADVSYSHPGQLLWTKVFLPAQYTAGHIWTVPEGEWWHDPGTANWIHPGDHNIYQFDFYPLPHESFIQVEGNIYWLAMEYSYDGERDFEFGWKTTPDAFNDDACYYDPTLAVFWKDLIYGSMHERKGESLEFAFALSGEEGDVEDWGDAPDPTYPTLSASTGARHVILTNFFLGARIDAEWDGQPTAAADGDDLAVFDDEDGVAIGSLIRGSNVAVNVFLTSGIGGGLLDAWVDFDGNGTWVASEKVFNGTALAPGANALSFSVPSSAALGGSYARFRLSSAGLSSPAGAASDGEVEDYAVTLLQPVPSPNILITNLYFNASNTVATVEWNSQSGITYQMQATTNLMVSNSWVDVEATVDGPINWQTNNMSAQSNKFYRMTAPWTP